jgi:hypothetical protein
VRAQIAAWVLFCSLSFRRIAFICTSTVDSVITSLRAMILFDAPPVSVRKITSSRRDRLLATSLPGISCSPTEARNSGDRISASLGGNSCMLAVRSLSAESTVTSPVSEPEGDVRAIC